MACLSKAQATARVDVPTLPTAMLCFDLLNSLMLALHIIDTQKSYWNEKKRRHCLGPWSLTQPGVFSRKPFHSQTSVWVQQSVFLLPLEQGFVSRRSSKSDDLDSSSRDDVRTERSELATRHAVAVRRTLQLAAAVGTCPPGTHPPPPASAWRPLAAPGLVATRRNHRPAAHARGDRPRQNSSCHPGRPAHSSRCTR